MERIRLPNIEGTAAAHFAQRIKTGSEMSFKGKEVDIPSLEKRMELKDILLSSNAYKVMAEASKIMGDNQIVRKFGHTSKQNIIEGSTPELILKWASYLIRNPDKQAPDLLLYGWKQLTCSAITDKHILVTGRHQLLVLDNDINTIAQAVDYAFLNPQQVDNVTPVEIERITLFSRDSFYPPFALE